jgi:hypothetical protein
MPDARLVGELLAEEFLREGYFTAARGPVEVRATAAAAAASLDFDLAAPVEAFAGLEVQAVGHEVGIPDPRVFVYLTRGSAKAIKGVPREIGGVSIVARKIGNVVVRPDAAATVTNQGHYYERRGRVCCGSSCAPTSEDSSGTLGALVTIGSADLFLLSNNHVFAGCNHVPREQPIMSPSNNDGRAGIQAPREIGRHSRIVELRSGTPEFVPPGNCDIALARTVNANIVSSWQGDPNTGYDTPSSTIPPVSFMRVKKFGRTTGLTFGDMETEVSAPLPVQYSAKYFSGTVWFEKVWAVRNVNGPFAQRGDSGSLVVTEDGLSAVGLVFAAGPRGDGFVIPMANITTAFAGLRLISGHGVT